MNNTSLHGLRGTTASDIQLHSNYLYSQGPRYSPSIPPLPTITLTCSYHSLSAETEAWCRTSRAAQKLAQDPSSREGYEGPIRRTCPEAREADRTGGGETKRTLGPARLRTGAPAVSARSVDRGATRRPAAGRGLPQRRGGGCGGSPRMGRRMVARPDGPDGPGRDLVENHQVGDRQQGNHEPQAQGQAQA